MTNLLFHNYYYRYRQQRKLVKDIVDIGSYQTAKTKLEGVIVEHVSKFDGTRKDFNYGEKLMMEHAKRHLDTVIDMNDPEFTDNGVIKHHSDIVKEALLREPKQDYS